MKENPTGANAAFITGISINFIEAFLFWQMDKLTQIGIPVWGVTTGLVGAYVMLHLYRVKVAERRGSPNLLVILCAFSILLPFAALQTSKKPSAAIVFVREDSEHKNSDIIRARLNLETFSWTEENLTDAGANYYYPRLNPQRNLLSTHVYPADALAGDGCARLVFFPLSQEGKQASIDVETGLRSVKFASWSNDGSRVVFAGEQGGTWNLYISHFEQDEPLPRTDSPCQLTSSAADDIFPSWSPDDKRIAFVRAKDDDREIYVIAPDGSNLSQLTSSSGWDWHPAWSPDSQTIAFTSERTGSRQVFFMNSDGKNERQITYIGSNMEPQWSPDGKYIVFSSDRDDNWEIFIMDADGGNQRRLTNNPLQDFNPYWR